MPPLHPSFSSLHLSSILFIPISFFPPDLSVCLPRSARLPSTRLLHLPFPAWLSSCCSSYLLSFPPSSSPNSPLLISHSSQIPCFKHHGIRGGKFSFTRFFLITLETFVVVCIIVFNVSLLSPSLHPHTRYTSGGTLGPLCVLLWLQGHVPTRGMVLGGRLVWVHSVQL